MKSKNLLLSVLACAAVCACSDEESATVATTSTFTADAAYVTVRLCDAGTSTKATDGGFEYGTTDEQNVGNAYFFFYDENGVFVSEGSAWNGGEAGTTDNVELESNTVVVLQGLTSKNYPKYMVTVLNCPGTFEAPMYLEDMGTVLTDTENIILDESGNFIMSTSSYSSGATYYYVNELEESNFFLQPVDDDANSDDYIDVYVERLAAKVALSVSATADSNGYYPIGVTIAGSSNTGTEVAADTVYVELLGWKVNATANNSYLIKNIDESWSLDFTWNDDANYRSYWGMSYNYGLGTYPTSAAEANVEGDYLTYYNLQDETDSELLAIDDVTYCPENTNTSAVVTANYPQCLTSILLKARICDEDGNDLSLVRFNGVLFEQDAFTNYILYSLSRKNKLNAYVKADDDTYTQIDITYVVLESDGDGAVIVQLSTSETLYAKDGDTFTEITDTASLDDDMAAECAGAIGYNGGLMYYNIPLEHLNTTTYAEGDDIPEGVYGVVRNHYYYVTVTSLTNLGKGIFDPDEVIVPSGDDESYYVGATINVLSWKLVEQEVEL